MILHISFVRFKLFTVGALSAADCLAQLKNVFVTAVMGQRGKKWRHKQRGIVGALASLAASCGGRSADHVTTAVWFMIAVLPVKTPHQSVVWYEWGGAGLRRGRLGLTLA